MNYFGHIGEWGNTQSVIYHHPQYEKVYDNSVSVYPINSFWNIVHISCDILYPILLVTPLVVLLEHFSTVLKSCLYQYFKGVIENKNEKKYQLSIIWIFVAIKIWHNIRQATSKFTQSIKIMVMIFLNVWIKKYLGLAVVKNIW